MHDHISRIISAAALISLLCLAAYAQSGSGEIRGTVTDSNGGVVPGATVEVTNNNTGVKHTVTANDAGLYVVPQLPVGVYTVTATQTGFAPTTVQSVTCRRWRSLRWTEQSTSSAGQISTVPAYLRRCWIRTAAAPFSLRL